MPINITGHQLKVTEKVRKYIEKKLPRLEKYSDKAQDIDIVLSKDSYNYTAEMALKDGAISVRAKTKNPDLLAAVDDLIDKMERVITKERSKRVASKRKTDLPARGRMEVDLSAMDLYPLESEESGGRWAGGEKKEGKGAGKGGGKAARGKKKPALDRDQPLFIEKLGLRLFTTMEGNIDVMSLEAAAEELFFKDENCLCFVNSDTDRLGVIYRRKDGNFGFFEPAFAG
ncbi:ribosomal subunit interface protein [candidate division BRC1 bacterium HGW-BRC1-1]|jgi:putative sigma-54 modulation protein|nr:MAG: ribosomal subunit interface protein [candidate division BRC1 bacterium HGW-BRC1-1]